MVVVKDAHIAALQTQLSGMLKTKSKVYIHKFRVHCAYRCTYIIYNNYRGANLKGGKVINFVKTKG